MGKKKITNKFAQTKRMISSQDQRMYDTFNYSVNKIKSSRKSMIASVNKLSISKRRKMFKSEKCNFDNNADPNNLRVCFSCIIMLLDHLIEFC